MKKCDNCDEEYEDHLDVCPVCGMRLEKIDDSGGGPPSGEDEVDEPDEEDTKPDQEECPNCGTINPSQANYCIDCSTELGTEGGQPAGLQDTGGQLALNIGSADGETLLQISDKREEVGQEDFINRLSQDGLKYIQDGLKYISRRSIEPQKNQFEIIPENGKYYILDNNSVNGTWLNGENIKGRGKKELSDGDIIKPANHIKVVVSLR